MILPGALLWACSEPAPSAPADLGRDAGAPGDLRGDDAPPDAAEPVNPLYPRPGALPPSFQPTPPPRPVAAQGTVVAIWDLNGGELSRDAVAVRQALSAMGIPSEIVSRGSELEDFRLAVLTGDLTDVSLTAANVGKVDAALRGGTAVLAVAPRAAALEALAGIEGRAPEAGRRALVLEQAPADEPLLQDLRALALGSLPLAEAGETVLGQGYKTGTGGARVLARFDDGSAALLRQGGLYVLGLRAQYYLDLLSGLGSGFGDSYTNAHYVQGDLLPLLLRRFYLAHAPSPQVRRTAPEGRRAAVILTHDCDSPVSDELVPTFAEIERGHGVRSTFLISTSPYRNGIIGETYTQPLIDHVRGLIAEGFDVGNHSFGHFRDFHTFPVRLGGESAANYQPMYRMDATSGGSIFGEMQISRALLEEDLAVRISSFRPGFLVTPHSYYEQLTASGHLRSSTRPSGIVRTNFPFQAARVRPGGYDLYPIIEYPLAISDRGLDDGNVAEQVARWLAVIDRNAITGAPTVLLIHPSGKPGRAEALSGFLDAVKGRGLWVGDLRTFAEFYEAQGF